MSTKVKSIRSIQFLPDKVIVDQGEHRLFQFCKACKDGKHLKNFLNDSCPQVDLQMLDEATAIRLERRFYHNLARGAARYGFYFEAQAFGEYVQRRCELLKKRQERMERKVH